MSAAFIVTGRTLLDWALCGKRVPADVVRLGCLFCGIPLTITAEGARNLEDRRRDPEFDASVCGAACVACVKLVAEKTAHMNVTATAAGVAAVENTANGRELLDFLMRRER